MTALWLFFLLLPQQEPSSCVVCHGKEGRELAASIHARSSIGCTDCHGGNAGAMEVAAAHGDSLRRFSNGREIVEACGGCHSDVERMRLYGLRTDQSSLYWTSRHGQALEGDAGAQVAVCSSCHGAHGILPVADTRSPVHPFNQVATCGKCHADQALMTKYGVPGGEVEAYRSSVHGRALLDEGHTSAPACADCHGSHGAAPPRSQDVDHVCGQCHSVVQGFFDDSPHAHPGTAGAAVLCTSCHGNHAVAVPTEALFAGDEKGHCGECHVPDAGSALAVAAELQQAVLGLEKTIGDADQDIRDAAGRGLFLGPERGYVDDARGLLVRARSLTHRLSAPALEDILNRGRAMVGQTRESLATKARTLRDRKIFASVFAAVSAAFALVLWMYSRAIGGRWKAPREADRA